LNFSKTHLEGRCPHLSPILYLDWVGFCEQQLEDSASPAPHEQSADEKAQHDLKNILFTTKQIYELWAEGSFGPVSEQQKEILKLLIVDNRRIIEILGLK
jgi:hypothetical protein